ncbi:hypothetical protein [Gracilimonas tropica]|nr:hypothetical protein [Gracilimonas tropica]
MSYRRAGGQGTGIGFRDAGEGIGLTRFGQAVESTKPSLPVRKHGF